MSRKSARILSRRSGKRKATDDTDQELIETFNNIGQSRKRKAEEDPEMSMEVAKRRKQFQIQNQWIPISHDTAVPSSTVIPTKSPATIHLNRTSPHNNNVTPKSLGGLVVTGSTFRFQNFFTTPIPVRESPLPRLQWADSQEVWEVMLRKEEQYVKSTGMLDRHPSLQPRMRAILLDWLIEVCEVYRLHRESFYLAVDFIDRYLCIVRNVQKQQLQLLGITSLFIAAKLEEIYPPKLTEFAYVTDGACTENEILEHELVILKALKWDLSPMTPNSWLNVYMQLVNHDDKKIDYENDDSFVFPQYSQHAFIQIARLLDLCLLDIECLQFNYSVLATTALYHMSSEHIALSVSGYTWMDIAACVQWMAPHCMTLREVGVVELKFFQGISSEDTHNIQTHTVDLHLLEKGQNRKCQLAHQPRNASPDFSRQHPGIITPPQSTKAKLSQQDNEQQPGEVIVVLAEGEEIENLEPNVTPSTAAVLQASPTMTAASSVSSSQKSVPFTPPTSSPPSSSPHQAEAHNTSLTA